MGEEAEGREGRTWVFFFGGGAWLGPGTWPLDPGALPLSDYKGLMDLGPPFLPPPPASTPGSSCPKLQYPICLSPFPSHLLSAQVFSEFSRLWAAGLAFRV